MSWHGYAESKLEEFLKVFADSVRDLQSDDLSPYYDNAPEVSTEDAEARRVASQAFRDTTDLPAVGTDSFSSQISSGNSRITFQEFVVDMGIESTYVEDLFEEEATPTLVNVEALGPVISNLIQKGFTPDADSVLAKFSGLDIPVEEGTIFHLDEPLPSVWAEEDSIIAEKLRRARRYVIDYLELEG